MMRSAPNMKITLAVSLLLVSILACSSLNAYSAPVATSTPTAAPLATATAAPLFQQVQLTSVNFDDSGRSPEDYQITAQIPSLTGSNDPRVTAFNQATDTLVKGAVAEFKKNMNKLAPPPIQATSMFDMRYTLLSSPGNIYSLKFESEGYIAGAAHPYHLTYTFNYDLGQGKELALSNLFLPNTDYLETIANYCAAQLNTRDIGFDMFQQGAAPMPENYKNWNITPDGLMITFDEYQVAPYAAGPQTVVVPYAELLSVIDSNGPLENQQ